MPFQISLRPTTTKPFMMIGRSWSVHTVWSLRSGKVSMSVQSWVVYIWVISITNQILQFQGVYPSNTLTSNRVLPEVVVSSCWWTLQTNHRIGCRIMSAWEQQYDFWNLTDLALELKLTCFKIWLGQGFLERLLLSRLLPIHCSKIEKCNAMLNPICAWSNNIILHHVLIS